MREHCKSKIFHPLEEVWSRESLRKILNNEKYLGRVMLQKTFVADCLNHKQIKNDGQQNKYEITNNHVAIIKEEFK